MDAREKQKDFDDIVAEKADWNLLNTASSTFDPRKMVCVHSQRIEYRITWFSKVFMGLFVVVGLGGLVQHKAFIMFTFMGLLALYWSSFPIVFDKKKQLFLRGRKSELFMPYIEIGFSEIYALQLIGGCVSGSDGGAYNNYQINLINKDSKRLNVVYFSNKKKAKKNAVMLRDFLNTRLWDAT